MSNAITVEGLGKRYRIGGGERYLALRDRLADLARFRWRSSAAPTETFWALQDVSFTVPRGEVVGVIGRNGAGKSTLLKLLSRITEPTAGRAEVRGRVGSLLEVGTGFHPELTGRENIYLNGAIIGMTRAEIRRQFDAIVAFAEVERFLDTPVKHFSSGMYLRLAFAVAAHLDPEILLVDEVLAVGDAAFQRKCLGKMAEVTKAGRTVLFVSHNLGAIRQLCSTCLLIDQGRLTRHGPAGEVIDAYLAGERAGVRWERDAATPASPWFAPLAMTVVDGEGRPVAMPCADDRDLWLAIDAEIASLNPALVIGYALSTADGQLLYWSFQTDRGEGDWPRLRVGRQRLLGRIPARLLNQGLYRLALVGGLHFQEWLFEPGQAGPAVALEIGDVVRDSPLWTHARPGLLTPVLEWKVIQ